MAKFDFVLFGSAVCHRLDVRLADLDAVVEEMESRRFLAGELDPDEWGQVRRVLIRSDRVQLVVEAE